MVTIQNSHRCSGSMDFMLDAIHLLREIGRHPWDLLLGKYLVLAERFDLTRRLQPQKRRRQNERRM